MKQINRKAKQLLTWAATLGLMIMVAPGAQAADTETNNPPQSEEAAPVAAPTYQNYTGLAELITMICNDSLERFQGFFGPSIVKVEPFTTIGFLERNKQSELGMTLADQMTAVINNDTLASSCKSRGPTPQSLRGVLQEVDGYLRIHISGVNAAGERTSYVVTVEMSDPIYRALHTYL